jgi:hypothetical protein
VIEAADANGPLADVAGSELWWRGGRLTTPPFTFESSTADGASKQFGWISSEQLVDGQHPDTTHITTVTPRTLSARQQSNTMVRPVM